MDGTVLRNGAQELPDGFTDLILRLKDCGVHFVAASGRQYQNLRRLFGPIQNEISSKTGLMLLPPVTFGLISSHQMPTKVWRYRA